MYNIFELNEKSLDDLKIIATEMGIDDENRDRTQLIYDIIDHQVDHPDIKRNNGNNDNKGNKNKKQKNQKDNNPEPNKPMPQEQPIEMPVAEVLENMEIAEPKPSVSEAQPGKRGKRPRIVKNAEPAEMES